MKTLVLFFALAALALGADISGKWTFEVVLDAGSGSPTFEFTQAGETLTGMYHGQFGDAKVTGTVKGDKVELSFGSEAGSVKYSGTLDGACESRAPLRFGSSGHLVKISKNASRTPCARMRSLCVQHGICCHMAAALTIRICSTVDRLGCRIDLELELGRKAIELLRT